MWKTGFGRLLAFILFGVFWACSESETPIPSQFIERSPDHTGIDFTNTLSENDSLNYFTNAYIYMGGGVAAGDINNDGLIDLYFTGNMVSNKLYLNKGNLQFEDISETAGVSGDNRWYTGVTMADVNADGFLDIYCSVSGLYGTKENQLFVNNGDLSFTEAAKEYGLADSGNSVQATFFDYDKDGDLDMYLSKCRAGVNDPNDPRRINRLFQNDGTNNFIEVGEQAGLKLGDRTQVGALLLAASLVADLLLIAARVVWIVSENGLGPRPSVTARPASQPDARVAASARWLSA